MPAPAVLPGGSGRIARPPGPPVAIAGAGVSSESRAGADFGLIIQLQSTIEVMEGQSESFIIRSLHGAYVSGGTVINITGLIGIGSQ